MDPELKEFLFGWRPFRRDPEYKQNNKGLSGFQLGGPRVTHQTSLGVFDYLKSMMTKHFNWSPNSAESWLQKQASNGNLEAEVLAGKGITLISPDGNIEYEFTKLSDRSWEVVKIKPDIPMPEG